jgi:hypothetical protein
MQVEFMVPVYHEVATTYPLEAVSLHGALLLILIVGILLFKFRLSTPKKRRKQ